MTERSINNRQEIETKIRNILSQELGLGKDVSNTDSLFNGGLLESIDMINLVVSLEQVFSIKISALEVNLENFDSIKLIHSYIENIS